MEKMIQIEIRCTRGTVLALVGLTLLLVALVLLWRAGPVAAEPGTGVPQSQVMTGIAASVGNRIHYQGRLTGASGPVEVTFRLWSSALGTELDDKLWQETKTVQVTSGLFDTQLGDTAPLPAEMATGRELWLGVEVEHDSEMVPRQEILPVPYALSLRPGARIAGSLAGKEILDLSNTQGMGLNVYGLSSTEPAARFYNPFGVAVEADGSIRSTAESYQWFPGSLARVRVGTDMLALIFHGDGKVRLDAATDGTKEIVIPLSVPAVLYGQQVTITSIRVPYHCAGVTSDSSIVAVNLYRNDGAGNYRSIADDTTTHSCAEGTTWQDIDIPVNADNMLSSTDGILSLEISTQMQAAGSANRIYIGGVGVSLAHTPEIVLNGVEGPALQESDRP